MCRYFSSRVREHNTLFDKVNHITLILLDRVELFYDG